MENITMGNVGGKRLLSVEEAAKYLGISPRTIYNAVAPKSKNPFPVKPKRIENWSSLISGILRNMRIKVKRTLK